MTMDDSAYSTGNHKDASFADDAHGPGWSEEFPPGPMSADQDAQVGSKDHFEELEDPCRDALMDCYNR